MSQHKNSVQNNVRKFRTEAGYSQSELARVLTSFAKETGALNRDGSPIVIRPINVNKWETRNATPREEVSLLLAHFFETDVETILGRRDYQRSLYKSPIGIEKSAYAKIEDVDDLNYYNGDPVWVEDDADSKTGKWALVNTSKRCLVFPDASYMDFSSFFGENALGTIYLGPSSFSVSLKTTGQKPLDLDTLKNGDKVYIKTIAKPSGIREAIEGWYSFKKEKGKDRFLSEDKLPLPASLYGKDFVCFESPIS